MDEIRKVRLERIANFLNQVAVIMEDGARGKESLNKIRKLSDYRLSFAAARDDELLKPITERCEQILELLITDGLTNGSPKKISVLLGQIQALIRR